jgi:hypothetical protein
MSADGATDYGYMTPYPYGEQNGFNEGVTGLYFGTNVITWGGSYKLRVSEIPGAFAVPLDFDTTIPATAWSSFTDQEDNRTELATNIYQMAQSLESQFDESFFQSAGDRQVFTGEGDAYFRGAILNLQAMAPSLFLIQQVPVSSEMPEYTTDQFDAYEDRFDGTWVGDSMDATAEQLGTDDPALAMMLVTVLPMSLVFVILSSWKFRRIEPGFAVVPLILLMAVLMGWMPKAVFASVYQASAIYSAFLIFYSRG